MVVYLVIALAVIVVDQLVKWWIVQNVAFGETIFSGNGLVSITHIRNEGAAWSILEGKMWFFYLITVITVAVVGYLLYKYRRDSKWLATGLSLILGGALGNFIDRLYYKNVVDMIQLDFINFPIFNVADMALSVGVVCVLIYIIKDEKKNKVELND